MDIIKNWFENSGYEIEEYEATLQAKTDTILFLVVEPHDGTNGKWMLRVAALVSFDRWANSTAVEEFFDTETGLRNYLENNQLYIYKDVLRSLSEEYEEICECRCVGLEEWKTEEEIENNCTECEQQYI